MQEVILKAFEAAKWPARIDNPLPPGPKRERQFIDAVNALNENQVNKLLEFTRDGKIAGIYWRAL